MDHDTRTMTDSAGNKHANRSAQTRERFIEVAEALFAQRSIDAVSVNEITVAAGQKNRNALQYHFGNRDGLLQAIIDRHAKRVHTLRMDYMESNKAADHSLARAAARSLIVPLARYIEEDASGVHYVRILSQLAALNSELVNPATRSGVSFQSEEALARLMGRAMAHLSSEEAQRRLFVTVSITFHGLADACRAAESPDITASLAQRAKLCDQVALAVETLLCAPPAEPS